MIISHLLFLVFLVINTKYEYLSGKFRTARIIHGNGEELLK